MPTWHGDFSCGKNVEVGGLQRCVAAVCGAAQRGARVWKDPIGNPIFLHEFSAQSTIIIVMKQGKEAINAPIVESLLSNQDKIPSLL